MNPFRLPVSIFFCLCLSAFDYDVHGCGSFCIYPAWTLLSFLDIQINVFHQICKVFSHYFFEYFFCSFLALLFWYSPCVYVDFPNGFPHFSEAPVHFSYSFFLPLFYSLIKQVSYGFACGYHEITVFLLISYHQNFHSENPPYLKSQFSFRRTSELSVLKIFPFVFEKSWSRGCGFGKECLTSLIVISLL